MERTITSWFMQGAEGRHDGDGVQHVQTRAGSRRRPRHDGCVVTSYQRFSRQLCVRSSPLSFRLVYSHVHSQYKLERASLNSGESINLGAQQL